MEKIINLDPEVQRQDRIGRYFNILKGMEEDALHKYELNKTTAGFNKYKDKNAFGEHYAEQRYRALLKLNQTQLGRKLARITQQKNKLLKER